MKIIIGRRDKADFPAFKLENIDIKIDTGAFTSSIHCHYIKKVMIDGELHVEFKLLDPSHPLYTGETFTFKCLKKKRVKSSFGASEQRFLIETNILIFEKEYLIELSLSERSEMKYPILIGRRLLDHQFIVDTSTYNLSYKDKQNSTKIKSTKQLKLKKTS